MPHRPQHRIEQLARAPDKRLALTILFSPRGLADHQQLGVLVADAEHRLRTPAAQLAAGARTDFRLQRLPLSLG